MGPDSRHKNDIWRDMKNKVVATKGQRRGDTDPQSLRALSSVRRCATKYGNAHAHICKVVHDCQSSTPVHGESSSIYIPFRAQKFLFAEYQVAFYIIYVY